MWTKKTHTRSVLAKQNSAVGCNVIQGLLGVTPIQCLVLQLHSAPEAIEWSSGKLLWQVMG